MSLTTILAFVFVLGVVIVIHEGGHFLVAKAVGIYVKVFSVGFGPQLLKKRWGQTVYALSAIPFGGYVKMAGEGIMEEIQDAGTGGEVDADGDEIPPDEYFSSKSPWQRMAVVLAGPAMNLVLALVVCIGLVWFQGIPVIPTTTVGAVDEDSPAAQAGLIEGDVVLEVADTPVENWEDVLTAFLAEIETEDFPVAVAIERDGEPLLVEITPVKQTDGKRWILGLDHQRDTKVGKVKKDGPAYRAGLEMGDVIVSIDGEPVDDYGQVARIINESIDKPLEIAWTRDGQSMSATITPEAAEVPQDYKTVRTVGRIYYEAYVDYRSVSPGEAIKIGSRWTGAMVTTTADFLGALVRGRASREAVSGPIGIGKYAGDMVRWGFDRLLQFLALFSVNLFLLNLLPIPVLDGGHAVFILYEMVARRRPDERVQMVATQVGFVLLLLIMAFVITMDVIKVAS